MDILLTGGSGFLGKTIQVILNDHSILVLGRSMQTNIPCDLSKSIPAIPKVDLVIHAAGKAHVIPQTRSDHKDFQDVNVVGTQNLLKGLEMSDKLPKYFVFISSVAVYGMEFGENISEDTCLNAIDTYGCTKIKAEKIVKDWCKANNIICSILRLPLLVGRNPSGNLAAMIKGIRNGYYFNIAGGKARKSMVLVEDVAKIIPKVAIIGGIYNLTDGEHPSFAELSELISSQMRKRRPLNMPLYLAKGIGFLGDLLGKNAPFNSSKLKKITSNLMFDDSKARILLGWNPSSVLKKFEI